MPYLDTLRWVFIAVALAGIAVTIFARLGDWNQGGDAMLTDYPVLRDRVLAFR